LKCLIVTADDFGAAAQVNEAVETAHRAGILSAASLMVSGAAAADAIARARRLPSLRVGLHVVLVQGRPILPLSAVAHLVDAEGRFRSDLAGYGAAIAASAQVRRELAAEISAQFAAFCDSGLTLDHCNAHQHYHLHPVVGHLLAVIAPRFGAGAIRLPLEPTRTLRAVEPGTPRLSGLLLAPLVFALRQRLRAAGLVHAERMFGLRWSGHMSRVRLLGLLRHLPPGLSEIYLHPATGAFAGSAPGYCYREELDALTSAEVVAACEDSSIRLGGFADFLKPAASLAPAARLDWPGTHRP
jgi:hopanoid biosynthesis associated protein HpnK